GGVSQDGTGQLVAGLHLVKAGPATDGEGDPLVRAGSGAGDVAQAELRPGASGEQQGHVRLAGATLPGDGQGLVHDGDRLTPFTPLGVADGPALTNEDARPWPTRLLGPFEGSAGVLGGGVRIGPSQ